MLDAHSTLVTVQSSIVRSSPMIDFHAKSRRGTTVLPPKRLEMCSEVLTAEEAEIVSHHR